VPVVHEKQVGMKFDSQRDRLSFASPSLVIESSAACSIDRQISIHSAETAG
jgi:hypothetical protein